MAEASRAEHDAQFAVEFGVPVESVPSVAIVEQFIEGDVSVECCHGVLNRDAVPGFIEEDWVDGVAPAHESVGDEHFGYEAVRAASVSGHTFDAGDGGKEDDGVANDLDVLAKLVERGGIELRLSGIEA